MPLQYSPRPPLERPERPSGHRGETRHSGPLVITTVRMETGAATTAPHPLRPEVELSSSYPIPAAPAEYQETIRRSRFLTYLGHAPDEATAKAFLESIRQRHPDASHHCWAYNAGPPGDTATIGMSDDGEPRGTAGRPMLNTLLHADLGEAVVVCARFFGGTKLGTGGLVRAYTSGVNGVIARVRTTLKVERSPFTVTVGYDLVQVVEKAILDSDVTVLDRSFQDRVTFSVLVPVSLRDGFLAYLADASRGGAEVAPGQDRDNPPK